jgi:hypothetical protein
MMVFIIGLIIFLIGLLITVISVIYEVKLYKKNDIRFIKWEIISCIGIIVLNVGNIMVQISNHLLK